MLTVLAKGYNLPPNGKKDQRWICVCDCGNFKVKTTGALNYCAYSCGCKKAPTGSGKTSKKIIKNKITVPASAQPDALDFLFGRAR